MVCSYRWDQEILQLQRALLQVDPDMMNFLIIALEQHLHLLNLDCHRQGIELIINTYKLYSHPKHL